MSEVISLADLCESHGITVEAKATGRAVDPFVRDVYNTLDDGTSVYVFPHDADDAILADFAKLDSVVNGDAVVHVCKSDDDVTALRRKIHYRNKLNVAKDGKPRAKLTLGAAILGDTLRIADVPIAFSVKPGQ